MHIKTDTAQQPGEFTSDWFTNRIPHLREALARFSGRSIHILEIGSFEGRSATFFLETAPGSRITCVDIWPDEAVEGRFNRNLGAFVDRLRKIKAPSVPALHDLAGEGQKFDIIYIDGNHDRHPVLADTVLAWPLLKVGGIIVWDDYRWRRNLPSAERPEHAVDLWCEAFAPCMRELHRGYQLVAEKTAEWPEPSRWRRAARPIFQRWGRSFQKRRNWLKGHAAAT